MEKRKKFLLLFAATNLFFIQACGLFTFNPPQLPSLPELPRILPRSAPAQETVPAAPQENPQVVQPPSLQPFREAGLLQAYQGALVEVYELVNPSVVNIRSVQKQTGSRGLDDFHNFPLPGLPESDDSQEFFSQGQGSGFVWDEQGHIVTNNHVIEGADKVEVTFSNGKIALAEIIGTDPYTDLAVLQVTLGSEKLVPVQMARSNEIKVGQLAIAIGNPFGLNGTMTVGIISGLGRDLPVESTGSRYRIPDIIQTDAPINPGNSGGVLVDIEGRVMGVTAAIQSPVRANAGVGFVIPAAIVEKVVPSLIEKGVYEHAWIGFSGRTLIPEIALAMGFADDTQGTLVVEVLPSSPALKAGLRGSTQSTRIEGINVPIGGDVIVSIDGETIRGMDDVIAYLARNTVVGQKIVLGILREGKQIDIELTLAARPPAN
jgi:serine protease Do